MTVGYLTLRPDLRRFRRRGAGGGAGPDLGLRHVVMYGQSLSIGSSPGGASVISDADPTHRMFSAGVRAHIDQLASGANENTPIDPIGCLTLVDLEEQVSSQAAHFGETLASGMAARLAARHAFTSTGRGAQSVNDLRRDSIHFHNTYAAMLYMRDAADAAGLTYTIPVFVWKQGEADAAGTMPRATWKERVIAMRDELRQAAMAAAHFDASAVPMLTDQLSYRQDPFNAGTGETATGYGAIAVAAIELHREGEAICVGPTYDALFVDNGDVHFSSQGYREHGERWGHVAVEIEAGRGWHPCHITEVSRSGATLLVSVHVPVAPLVKDTVTFADRLFVDDGFSYSGAGITGIVITDDGTETGIATISLALDAAAPGVLRYAYENARNANWNTCGGHFRDSSTLVSHASGKAMWNWLCTDEWEVA